MKKTAFLILLSLLSLSVWATSLSEVEAFKIAQKYHSGLRNVEMKESVRCYKTSPKKEPEFYIFNAEKNEGFIIVSGESELTEVVGYSDEGKFVYGQIPDNMRLWLDGYAQYVRKVRENKIKAVRVDNYIFEPVVSPLLGNIAWEQGFPYNEKCPYDESQMVHCVTGCVATAVGQIMKYWEWPVFGIGSHSYNSNYGELIADFSKEYKWELIKDEYIRNYDRYGNYKQNFTFEEQEAVAQLMYDIGVSVEMNYTPFASSSSEFDAAKALNQYFLYNVTEYSRSSFTTSGWEKILKKKIDARCPILMVGTNLNESNIAYPHAFVVDGYDTAGYFHVNWGWGKQMCGYYNINYLNPDALIWEDVANADLGEAYTWIQHIFIPVPCRSGIPDKIQQPLRFYFSDETLSVGKNMFFKYEPFLLSANRLWNDNSSVYNGELRVCIENSIGDIIKGDRTFKVENLKVGESRSIELTEYVPDLSNAENGHYFLYLESKEYNEKNSFDWIPLQYMDMVYFEIENDVICIDSDLLPLECGLEGVDIAPFHGDFIITSSFRNENSVDIDGIIQLDIYDGSNDAFVEKYKERAIVYNQSESEYNFKVEVSDSYKKGNHYYAKLSFVDLLGENVELQPSLKFEFIVGEEEFKQKELVFDSFEEITGLFLSKDRYLISELDDVTCYNLYNMNPEEAVYDLSIGVYCLEGNFVTRGENTQMHFGTYDTQNALLRFPDFRKLEDGKYYLELQSKEISQEHNYGWIPVAGNSIQRRTHWLFLKKKADWLYAYSPENVVEVVELVPTGDAMSGEDYSVSAILKNISFDEASGQLKYYVYEVGKTERPLMSGNMSVSIPIDGMEEFPITLRMSPDLYQSGKSYVLELSDYMDEADTAKTFIGNSLFFKVVGDGGVEDVSKSVSVYPNPVVDHVVINACDAICHVKLFDYKGCIVKECDGFGRQLVSMNALDLPKGFYILVVETETGVFSRKIVCVKKE